MGFKADRTGNNPLDWSHKFDNQLTPNYYNLQLFKNPVIGRISRIHANGTVAFRIVDFGTQTHVFGYEYRFYFSGVACVDHWGHCKAGETLH